MMNEDYQTETRPTAPLGGHPQLLLYKASAGSGKTFTLAAHYIGQLMQDPKAYRRILAVTFTNKATAEMKDRILSQLYGLSIGDKASDGYRDTLLASTGQTAAELRQAAAEALRNILHDYSRFRIETIDSFFQSVMRHLARELELGANLNIELSNTEVLEDAVDALIEKLDRQSPVLHWLLEHIEERIADDKSWKIAKEIKRFGLNIFNESYIEQGDALRKKLSDPQFIPVYRKKLESIRTDILEQMKGFADQFQGILEMNRLTPADLKNGSRGISSYFKKLAEGKLTNDVRNATVEKCLSSGDEWTAKSSKRAADIRLLAAGELIPLLAEAEKFRTRNNLLLNSCNLSLRYLNTLRLLSYIDSEVRLQNQMHNRFLLSDTNALLHGIIREGDASFVYEKIGTTIDAVMIDEFQDTSRMQWENFRLLLEESLSQKEGSLIVGDIKQSIYRWRNGDWKILAGLDKDPSFRVKTCHLDTNWRSEANIIRFNNHLFETACQVLDERHQEMYGTPCPQLAEAYGDVAQTTRKQTTKGFVRLTFLPDSAEEPYESTLLQQLALQVDQLVQQGVHTADIAILVRKNKMIPAIADYFDLHTPYRIVSDEAFRLDASLAVNTLIDGLRYLTSPDDRISLARLAVNYRRDILKEDLSLNTLLLDHIEDYLPAGFLLQTEELRLMPLYELLEQLFQLFGMERIEQQDAYLCAFYDAVTQYMQDHSSELTAFLAYWDDTLHEKTIPSGEMEGIRILSIHKSKGLEYHTVLLPFCDWKMENETNNHLLWCSPAPNDEGGGIAPFDELSPMPVDYSKGMAESIYHHNYREEQLQLWVDNLNLLYVAFTRACKNLMVWGKRSPNDTVSQLLATALPRMDQTLFHSTPDPADTTKPAVYELGTLCPSVAPSDAPSSNRLTTEPDGVTLHIESTDVCIEFKQSNRSADFIGGEEEETDAQRYIRQGRLLHRVFADIRCGTDIPRAVRQLRMEGVVASDRQEQEIMRLATWALRHPQVRSWYDGSWQLFNECSILSKNQDGTLKKRRPDRVMVKDGQVIVVDFKFGKPKDDYRMQVQEYMQLLHDMGYCQPKGFLWYVFKNELEEIAAPGLSATEPRCN